jgi:hypothetical protein
MTTNNPADVYGDSLKLGDKVRVLNGDYAFASGKIQYMTHTQAWLTLRVKGMQFTRGFPLNNLVKVK